MTEVDGVQQERNEALVARVVELLGEQAEEALAFGLETEEPGNYTGEVTGLVWEGDERAEAAESTEAESPEPIPPLDAPGKQLLWEIRRSASWNGPEARTMLASVLELFREQYAGHEAKAEQAVQDGIDQAKLKDEAYALALKNGKPNADFGPLRKKAARVRMPLRILEKAIDTGHRVWVRNHEAGPATRVVYDPPKSKPFPEDSLVTRRGEIRLPTGLHRNHLCELRPSSRWQVIIDETGREFGPDASSAASSRQGRFVAVVVPMDPQTLVPLTLGWHAVEQDSRFAVDDAVQSLLDANVGVFGVTIQGVPTTPGDRWMDGVGLLFDWILRLLPVDEATQIEVLVENRGDFKADDSWSTVSRDSIRRLALAYPVRAAKIDASIRVIRKTNSELLGYADAVAFTWSQAAWHSKARLARTHWQGVCLWEAECRELLHLWDAFSQGVALPGDKWWQLIHSQSAGRSVGIVPALLSVLGTECRADATQWKRYLSETLREMASGVVDLRTLGGAVNWLQEFLPANERIPAPLRLSWLTVNLAQCNHIGVTESAWEVELKDLGPGLIDEAAPLVCLADLHLAVARTNQFDFAAAEASLTRWQDLPVMGPGLRNWGRVQSSWGQHAALNGRYDLAVERFEAALKTFARLSDPLVRASESAQTGCYLALTLMDQEGVDPATVRGAVERVTGALPGSVAAFAKDEDGHLRYAHHLLLRWLVHRGDESIWADYRRFRSDWAIVHGHPGSMIDLYRALLLRGTDPDGALKLAQRAAEMASGADQGPVIRLIGACCHVIVVWWGGLWMPAGATIEQLRKELPKASERIDVLEAGLDHPEEPLAFLRRILPFNFR